MDDQLGRSIRSRLPFHVVLVLGGLLSPIATFAQTGTPPSTQQAPGPASRQAATQPPTAEQLSVWRAKLLKVPKPKKGCFTAEYPSTEWKEMPCTPPPARPYPPPASGIGPPNVIGGGGSNDVAAQVMGQIASATGSFDNVSNGTTETGTTFGSNCSNPTSGANIYSLQLNTMPFTTSVCTSNGCQGWQQFVYSNSYGGFIQYWLLNVGASCPAGWTSYQNGGQLDCWQNDPNGAHVPSTTDVQNLTQLQLTGTASTSGDSVTVTVAGHAYSSAPNSDGVLKLAQSWQAVGFNKAVEFNIFGDGCSSEAVFQGTPTIQVRTAVDDGTTNAPKCLAQSYTAETNNLSLVLGSRSTTGGSSPAITFTERGGGPAQGDTVAGPTGSTASATLTVTVIPPTPCAAPQ